MTVIVAIVSPGANVVMAADSRMSAGYSYVDGQQKLWRKGDMLIGAAGLALYSRVVQDAPDYHTDGGISVERYLGDLSDAARAFGKERGHGEVREGASYVGPHLIAATTAGIWRLDPDGCIIRSSTVYDCIGNGAPEARGALWMWAGFKVPLTHHDAAEMAVRCASDFDSGCGGRISVETIGYPLPLSDGGPMWEPPSA